MRFSGKEKRTLNSDFIRRYHNRPIYLGIPITDQRISILKSIGFQKIEHGETVLPAPIGKTTKLNANGQEVIHKDKPKEKAYHMIEWNHEEWHGPDREQKTTYIERSYKRYPRSLIPPPAKELSIFIDQGKELVISEKLDINESNLDEILHYVNIFLEIFGECDVYDENLELSNTQLKKVNWTILPKGSFLSRMLHETISPIISELTIPKQEVIWYRINEINRRNPEFIAVGQAGFKGYIVFAFPKKQIYVLESLFEGNATYVFDENWESLSKRTKAEILSQNLQKDRFIHKRNWKRYIRKLLD